MSENTLDIPTVVQNQMLHSLGPSHQDWVFHPSDTAQVEIRVGCQIPRCHAICAWIKKKVKPERKTSCSYWPCVPNYNCPFRNVVTIIFIVVSSHVGKTFRTRQNGNSYGDKEDLPRGNTKCQRDDSLTITLMYGSEERSSKSGKRFGPTSPPLPIRHKGQTWIPSHSARNKNFNNMLLRWKRYDISHNSINIGIRILSE